MARVASRVISPPDLCHGLQELYTALPQERAAAEFEQVMRRETNPRVRAAGMAYLAQVRSGNP